MANKDQSTTQMEGVLYVVRHGESEWNALGKWTGTTDVSLTEKGRHEARLLGEVMRDIPIDHTFVSEQVRTHQTADEMFKAMQQCRDSYHITSALNERDYGIYTGKNKWDLKQEIGEEEFNIIRRGWDNDVPDGENLKQVYGRVYPFYRDNIVPLLQKGDHVLVVAHGNSIRSLMKYVESISDEDITEVEMIFGEVLIYRIDTSGKMLDKDILRIDTVPPPA